MAPGLEDVDWSAPWFAPWRASGRRVMDRCGAGLTLPAALNEEASTVRFVAQAALAGSPSYEQHIFETGECPTRQNLHDFFNGLCWIELPLAKKRLNQLQAAEIARGGGGPGRGPVRDAITVLDENGALLQAPPALWEALLARDWPRLFIDLRPLWNDARVIVLGHALLEKLTKPRKQMTAHVWAAPCPSGTLAELDGWLATDLTVERLAAKPFAPLPVLGIPGWWPENQNFSFYDDSLVFRPARQAES